MSWTRSRHRRAEPVGRPWTPEEAEMLADAVGRAPSVHGTQPWSLTLQHRRASLWERHEHELLRRDPDGRRRRIACGAALTNLVLAVRNAGWSAEVRWAQEDDPAELVATVAATTQNGPSATEGQRYRAIMRRSSYHSVFEQDPVPHATRETLWAAASSPAVYARWMTSEADARMLAHQLVYCARRFHGDRQCQRELSAWTEAPVGEPGSAVPASAPRGAAAMGVTGAATSPPDEETLASRIEEESVLVLSTPSDAPGMHYEAGRAMELAWLAATSLGLVASVIVQPFHLCEIRTELARGLRLPGVPELVMRFGYPAVQLPRPPSQSGVDAPGQR